MNSNWSYSPETANLGKIDDFSSHATLKFDRWHCKTIGHLFYATSSFVHRFKAIGELKLQLQSGNASFVSKSTIFLAAWPEIWRMKLRINRAPLLSNIKLCASFHHHMWIQTENGSVVFWPLWPWPLPLTGHFVQRGRLIGNVFQTELNHQSEPIYGNVNCKIITREVESHYSITEQL